MNNQCAGCAEGLEIRQGVHWKEDDYFGFVPVQVCMRGMYPEKQKEKSPETSSCVCPRERIYEIVDHVIANLIENDVLTLNKNRGFCAAIEVDKVMSP